MSLAIQTEIGDLIYFDAVLNYVQNYENQVTQHPIETGGVISDHTIRSNPVVQFSGVISDADFNNARPSISNSDAETYGITSKQFVNNNPVTTSPVITTQEARFTSLLPESIAQFIDGESPSVVVPDAVKPRITQRLRQDLINLRDTGAEFTILEFSGDNVSRALTPCVITSLSFKEDADSGYALFPDITAELVQYAQFTQTTIPANVQSSVRGAATPNQNKGKQTPTDAGSTEVLNNPSEEPSQLFQLIKG